MTSSKEVIPESQASGYGDQATIGCIFGFVVMMTLDVALG
jgi:ZIP family zinc transporter